jgi:hypothetical protein
MKYDRGPQIILKCIFKNKKALILFIWLRKETCGGWANVVMNLQVPYRGESRD